MTVYGLCGRVAPLSIQTLPTRRAPTRQRQPTFTHSHKEPMFNANAPSPLGTTFQIIKRKEKKKLETTP